MFSQNTWDNWMDMITRPIYVLSTRDSPQNKRYTQTKCKGMEKIFYANGSGKNAGIATFAYDKIGFKTKTIIRGKGHYIMTKGAIQPRATILVNIYVPNMGAPKYIKQILMDKREGSTVIQS
ncbi:hypothetical protein HJG60_009716 [Phyllostomus discolor]|uniref:Uncharacterized protein n=1 Tax=Phyllostomus discolor TaxID=89673 RepID=A0A834BC29_9CHIR|nr:hypothetical protein HJG60_009716 [Phyllostomus discolor]